MCDLGDACSPGATLTGAHDGDSFGGAVSGAGDVNGDDIPDLVVAAIGAPAPEAEHERGAGQVYVFAGTGTGAGFNTCDLGAACAPQTTLTGNTSGDDSSSFGFRATGVGDINGDGMGDLLVNARGDSANYLWYGKQDGIVNCDMAKGCEPPATFTAQASPSPSESTDFGWGIGSPGDTNADGIDDMVIASPALPVKGKDFENIGEVYIWLGKDGSGVPGCAANVDDPCPQQSGLLLGVQKGSYLGSLD
jgi:hypothetical protein